MDNIKNKISDLEQRMNALEAQGKERDIEVKDLYDKVSHWRKDLHGAVQLLGRADNRILDGLLTRIEKLEKHDAYHYAEPPAPEPVCETCGGEGTVNGIDMKPCPSCQPKVEDSLAQVIDDAIRNIAGQPAKSCENCGMNYKDNACHSGKVIHRLKDCISLDWKYWTPKPVNYKFSEDKLKKQFMDNPKPQGEAWLRVKIVKEWGELTVVQYRYPTGPLTEMSVNPADLVPGDRMEKAEEYITQLIEKMQSEGFTIPTRNF